jgi:chromosome segregation protein
MYIRRIQIQGFKSFPDRTVLDFGPGITAIVGPNGCGKSNILDALRWCFGTQSPRQLRGASMQDVVFAGTEERSAAGFAEVAVTFVNDAGRAPAPWQEAAEIRIERRINRDGDGEYRIQGAKARLRDIQDLLMDIGYGDYSLIQQGTVGQLVQAKPAEVRELIEQAGRMTKYRARREEAQARLAATEDNLVRIDDLIGESARLVRSLERQAARAKEGRTLLTELRVVRAVRLQRSRRAIAADLREVAAAIDRGAQALLAVEQEIAALDASLAETHAMYGIEEGRLLELDAAWQAWRTRREAAVERVAAIKAELDGLQRTQVEAQHLRESAAASWEAQVDQLAVLQATAAQAAADLATAEAARTAARSTLAAARLAARESAEFAANSRDDVVEAMRDEASASNRRTASDIELRHLTERRAALSEQVGAAAALSAQAHSALAQAAAAQKQAAVDLERLRAAAAEAAAALQASRQAAAVAEGARLEAIRDLDADRRSLDRLRAALTQASEGGDWGEWHSLWLRVEPLPGQADLVETALARRLETLVGGDAATLVEPPATDGRRAFLLPGTPDSAAAAPPGCRPLHELLKAAEGGDRQAVERLTRGLWLSDVPIGPATPFPASLGDEIWDVDGRCLDGRGVLTIGALQVEGTAHVAAERADAELRVAAGEARLAAADSADSAARAALTAAAAAADAAREREGQAQLAAEAAAAANTRAEADLRRVTEEAQRLARDAANIDEAQAAAAAALSSAADQLAVASAHLAALRERMADATKQAEADQVAADQAEASARRADEAWQQAMLAAQESARAHAGLQRELATLTTTREDAARRQQSAAERIAQLQQDLGAAEQSALALADEGDRFAAARQEKQAAMSELRNRQSILSAKLRKAHEDHAAAISQQSERTARQVALATADAEALAAWAARFGEDPPNEVADDPRTDAELAAVDADLSARLGRLGTWDADAETLHAEEVARQDNLQRQRDDVTASIASLRESISKMNKESRVRFEQAFHEIDGRFREIFTRLFRGGHAELRLCEPGDWLESGVEIVARPPGTHLQRLELLSGGQSAMTAISLVLAIFMTHPSPFCILDEVDAPLDDANIARFNQVVVDLNQIAQIFLITHNKATMEIAGTLYGITMEARGISRAVPARLG